jgi:hypothetical protein
MVMVGSQDVHNAIIGGIDTQKTNIRRTNEDLPIKRGDVN